MNVSAGLVTKLTAGALATAAAIWGSVAAKNSDWFGSREHLTKFDSGLIEWLDKDGNDIVFTIKYKKSDGSEKDASIETTTIFSSFITEKDDPVKISVKVDDGDTNLKGTRDKNSLKGLNKNKNWTWICEMKFKKADNSTGENSIYIEHNKRVYGVDTSDNDGLFKKLIKNVTPSDSNFKKIKDLKKNFIRNCANSRTWEENRSIDASVGTENMEVKNKTTIFFELKIGTYLGKSSSELHFADEENFNKWFPQNINN